MNIKALTQDAVRAAADALDARGEKVTQNSVRTELGGGSFSTISAALKEWKEQRETVQADTMQAAPMPETLSKRFDAWQSEIWAVAAAAADERLTAEREALSKRAAELEERAADDAQAIQTLEAELKAAADEAAAAVLDAEQRAAEGERRAAAAQTELTKTAARLDVLNEQLQKAEQREQEASARLDDLIAGINKIKG